MTTSDTGRSTFWKSFGPGLIWAATSIGVSHLVQSTRAGAMAGFALVGLIIIALIVKYPFFEYGARYAAATRKSLIEGYRGIGQWALWLFLAITIVGGIVSMTALAMFAAVLVRFAAGSELAVPFFAAGLMLLCIALLAVGKYKGLDLTIKILLFILVVSTVAAVVASAPRADVSTFRILPGDLLGTVVPFAFVLALIGWMPSPVEVSVWSSLWTLAKDSTTGHKTTVGEARRDFRVGYIGTAILAIAFVSLGATVLFDADIALSNAGAVFATQLVDMYAQTLGAWSRPVVTMAAIATIFSSLLAVMDGYPRVLERTWIALRAPADEAIDARPEKLYWVYMGVFALTSFFVIMSFAGSLTTMVDFATTVAFLTAPILGYFNLRAITSDAVPAEHQPGRPMIIWTWVGLLLLSATGIAYLVSLL